MNKVSSKPRKVRKRSLWIALGLIAACIILFSVDIAAKTATASTLPDLTGRTVEQVNAVVEKRGFEVTYEWVDSNSPKGTVVVQKPAIEFGFASGKKIVVQLSKGVSSSPSSNSSNKPSKAGTTEPDSSTPEEAPAKQQTKQQSPSNGLTEQQRKAEIAKQKADADAAFNAEMAERKRLFDEQQAAAAAEQARIAALNNNYFAAYDALSQARSNYQYWEAQVNSFASRGMLDSGAGSQASAARNQAQIELANAEANLAAAQAARDAG